ncbi:MAG: V-type ATP synthase subunit A [Chromatiales bacterium]|nr:V-type ATP synthase subunit A [Chromatiales bacterium]
MSEARISWIGGPVLRAVSQDSFTIQEAILVGPRELPGEVIKLNGKEIIAQVFEDTTGLEPGELISGTGTPLSVRLGPGLLGHIFDGLLRPLKLNEDPFMEKGVSKRDEVVCGFTPGLAAEDAVHGGAILGQCQLKGITSAVLIPPGVSGTLSWIAPKGDYSDTECIARVRDPGGAEQTLAMSHPWPVRIPRPVRKRLTPDRPMITGQRVLDTLFPIAMGSRAALPGGFGTGKTILQEALAKWCDADIIVYVGCGERGNEMAEVLDEFPGLEDPSTGKLLMDRTVIIANTSNMPVAAREASIYTAITVAEYFRDQGLQVALMADSTSRWAEALREVSGRLEELPAEGGYPAYLSARLAEFYERAARVQTLSGDEGSVTIIGAVSPPAGDFSEPVTTHTKRFVRCFWALDRDMAQARFYPAIHPLRSYSSDAGALAHWWQGHGNPDWANHRRRLLTLLEEQAQLERMARIVGRESLPASQQLTLLCAELVNEGILRQSSFSLVDRYCSPKRQTAMLLAVMDFIQLAEKAVQAGASPAEIAKLPLLRRLHRLGEEFGEDQIKRLELLRRQLEYEVESLAGGSSRES